MHNSYDDIRGLTADEPDWWDENGVPRYGKFTPRGLADIYANHCALVLIACQGCGHKFDVAFSDSAIQQVERGKYYQPLSDQIKSGSLHYGDPPNIDCCGAGATMNCEDLRVLEFWTRKDFEWQRDHSLEISLPDAEN